MGFTIRPVRLGFRSWGPDARAVKIQIIPPRGGSFGRREGKFKDCVCGGCGGEGGGLEKMRMTCIPVRVIIPIPSSGRVQDPGVPPDLKKRSMF